MTETEPGESGRTQEPSTAGDTGACPCGSGLALAGCCGPYLWGLKAPGTAEALMRSRYTAYVLRDGDYLLESWHPDTRPDSLNLDGDETVWESLQVLRCTQGTARDMRGQVEFIARFRQNGRTQRMHEVSRFEKEQGRWYYRDGKVQTASSGYSRPGRNEPCSCGSGRKYKKCCGA